MKYIIKIGDLDWAEYYLRNDDDILRSFRRKEKYYNVDFEWVPVSFRPIGQRNGLPVFQYTKYYKIITWHSGGIMSIWQELKCYLDFHKWKIKKILGRPHIDHKTGLIKGRDPVITKYTCVHCKEVIFKGLRGGNSFSKTYR